MNEQIEATGQNEWFSLNIKRGLISGKLAGSTGLVVTVKADPSLETFMTDFCNGKTVGVAALANQWLSLTDKPLEVYQFPRGSSIVGKEFNLHYPGRELLFQYGNDVVRVNSPEEHVFNLSFLRLVGIGSPEGIQFGVPGAYSRKFVIMLSNGILAEVKHFMEEYVVPVDIHLQLVKRRNSNAY